MKTVIFVRHAKSSWSDPGLSDHDRPLNKRGKRDAPIMAAVVKARANTPDLLLSSTAKRAKNTAEVFRQELDLPPEQLILEKQLYHAYPETIQMLLRSLPDGVQSVAVFAHNPGLTFLANDISGNYIDNVPTTGVVVANCAVTEWKNFSIAGSQRTAFWYPKQFVE